MLSLHDYGRGLQPWAPLRTKLNEVGTFGRIYPGTVFAQRKGAVEHWSMTFARAFTFSGWQRKRNELPLDIREHSRSNSASSRSGLFG